jgi:cytochrome c peroxidase
MPKGFPLSGDGQIMCLTCHTGHGPFLGTVPAFAGQLPEKDAASAGSSSLYRTFFLRRSDPSLEGFEALCRECHGVL